MKKTACIYFFFLLNSSFAQKQSAAVRDFGPNFCDSIQEITKEYYDSHKQALSIIDTNNLPAKKDNRLVVPFGKDSLAFSDATEDCCLGLLYNRVVGINKKRGWILIESWSPPQWGGKYYLIDQKKEIVDTLDGFPYFYKNKMICIEAEREDWAGLIEIRQIKKGRKVLLLRDHLSRCDIPIPKIVAISDKKELMFYDRGKYWRIKTPLF